jgi:Ca2+-binding RTX toxin-like protein
VASFELVARAACDDGEGAMVRQRRSIALVVAFLIGCAVLLVVGCSRTRSEAPKEQQGHSGAAASEEARCEGTSTSFPYGRPKEQSGRSASGSGSASASGTSGWTYITNDLPGCPKGGLLKGTDKSNKLDGKEGDDEIRGLGAPDIITGGHGNDIIYSGPGTDEAFGDEGDDVIYGGVGDEEQVSGGGGEDVLYGGDGNDSLYEFSDAQPDKLYCGKGKDEYYAPEKNDYVDSSCEKKLKHIMGRA